MEKRMAYRLYKKRFDDCPTLGDYDKSKRTITVVIPDDDPRVRPLRRINTKVWKSYGNRWALKEAEAHGMRDTTFQVRQYEDGFYLDYGRPRYEWEGNGIYGLYSDIKYIDFERTACQNRDEAMDLLLQKWEAFKDWMGWGAQ